MVRVVVAGSRDLIPSRSQAVTFMRLWVQLGGDILLHGCCPALGQPLTDDVPEKMRGVDAWAEARAVARGIPVERFPPLQLSIGWPGCGPERNARMVKAGDAGILFPGGSGTASTRRLLAASGIPYFQILEDGSFR